MVEDKHTFSPGSRMLPRYYNEALHLRSKEVGAVQCWIGSMYSFFVDYNVEFTGRGAFCFGASCDKAGWQGYSSVAKVVFLFYNSVSFIRL